MKEMCIKPNQKCVYYKKYKCCGYCSKCPTERQGLINVPDRKKKLI